MSWQSVDITLIALSCKINRSARNKRQRVNNICLEDHNKISTATKVHLKDSLFEKRFFNVCIVETLCKPNEI